MRVTVDIDGKDRGWWAWSVYYMLRDYFKGVFSRVEIYKTRRGYHVVGYGSGLSVYEVMRMRRALGDDAVRIEIDGVKHPLQPRQVLWNRKDGYEVRLLDMDGEA